MNQVLDVLVKVCAIGGFLLGLFNFFKDHKKDKAEARIRETQNLVKAVHRLDRSNPAFHVSELYIINSDIAPVNNITANFFTNMPNQKSVCYSIPSLRPGEESCVERGKGRGQYASVKFSYTDSKGKPHDYDDLINKLQK